MCLDLQLGINLFVLSYQSDNSKQNGWIVKRALAADKDDGFADSNMIQLAEDQAPELCPLSILYRAQFMSVHFVTLL